ncbi:hypothetical protein WIW50_03160 [Flavobacteriaceae bacterium 3-367]
MRALAKIQHLRSDACKQKIIRNLSRLMDIRIIDIDVDNQMIFFLFEGPLAFHRVKQELWRIGYPITKYKCQNGKSFLSRSEMFDQALA